MLQNPGYIIWGPSGENVLSSNFSLLEFFVAFQIQEELRQKCLMENFSLFYVALCIKGGLSNIVLTGIQEEYKRNTRGAQTEMSGGEFSLFYVLKGVSAKPS